MTFGACRLTYLRMWCRRTALSSVCAMKLPDCPQALRRQRAAKGSNRAVAYQIGEEFEFDVFHGHISGSEEQCKTAVSCTVVIVFWALNDV